MICISQLLHVKSLTQVSRLVLETFCYEMNFIFRRSNIMCIYTCKPICMAMLSYHWWTEEVEEEEMIMIKGHSLKEAVDDGKDPSLSKRLSKIRERLPNALLVLTSLGKSLSDHSSDLIRAVGQGSIFPSQL